VGFNTLGSAGQGLLQGVQQGQQRERQTRQDELRQRLIEAQLAPLGENTLQALIPGAESPLVSELQEAPASRALSAIKALPKASKGLRLLGEGRAKVLNKELGTDFFTGDLSLKEASDFAGKLRKAGGGSGKSPQEQLLAAIRVRQDAVDVITRKQGIFDLPQTPQAAQTAQSQLKLADAMLDQLSSQNPGLRSLIESITSQQAPPDAQVPQAPPQAGGINPFQKAILDAISGVTE